MKIPSAPLAIAVAVALWALHWLWSSFSAGSQNPTPDIRLFVGIVSLAARQELRAAVRETWGRARPDAKFVFVCARPWNETVLAALRREAAETGDLVILEGIDEHYRNVTHQTLEVYQTALRTMPDATHVLKTDDDCVVRVDAVMQLLSCLPKQHTYIGYPMEAGGIISRNPNQRNYVPRRLWNRTEVLPTYGYGAGYILTGDLAREIASGGALEATPDGLINLEDVSTGLWVDHVRRKRGWTVNFVTEPRINWRNCVDTNIISHLGINATKDRLPDRKSVV